MTTTAVSLEITCPDWCITSPEEHAADLWNMGGTCIHRTADTSIEDHIGHKGGGLEGVHYAAPVLLSLTTETRPDGQEAATPCVTLHGGDELTLSQALAVADQIKAMVAAYRAAGGRS